MAKSFEDLPRSHQVRRLRRLAERALESYDLDVVRIVPLQHWLNTTFRVDALSQRDLVGRPVPRLASIDRYVLRIHRPGFMTPASIRSELLWLNAIGHDTDLAVPQIVQSRQGSPLVTVSERGIPGPRHCVLFRWIAGRFFREGLPSRATLRQAGVFMAKLHRHAGHFLAPDGFIRPHWDIDAFCGRGFDNDPDKIYPHLDAKAWIVLEKTVEMVQSAMVALGRDPEVHGLIHGDFTPRNLLVHRGEIRAIDFDNCGFGYYVYDIATAFTGLGPLLPGYSERAAAFLEGYRKERSLSMEQIRYIDPFIAARLLTRTLWFVGHLGEPMFGERIRALIPREFAIIEQVLDGTGLLEGVYEGG